MLSHIKEWPYHIFHIYLYSQLKTDNERLMAVVDGYENKFGRLVELEAMYRSSLPCESQK